MSNKQLKEKNLLAKYTERLASRKAIAIDNFIGQYIPSWQLKIMTKLPSTRNLFGWKIEHFTPGGRGSEGKEKLTIWKRNKLVATLAITERISL